MAVRTPDQLLAGRYRALGRLGSGGSATVYLAEDERLGRRVAVKRLHGGVADDDLIKRFRREARLGAALNHPNLVTVYDIASDDEGVVIVMECVEGHTLRDEIARGPVAPERALPILRGVAAALDHAHAQGVLHRDVKPGNILLREDGAVKLADLGIATAAEHTRITRAGSVVGTASYIAPERLDGAAGGPPADVYALAAVAFETLTGRRAVEGANALEVARRMAAAPPPDLRDFLPGAPAGAPEALKRGLARDPAARPSSAKELVEPLARAFATEAGANYDGIADAIRPTPAKRPTNRRPLALALGAVAVLALLILALSVGGKSHHASAPKPTKTASRPLPPVQARSIASPAATVNRFYQRAAAHDYAGAWALTTQRARARLGGLPAFSASQSTLRSISFPFLGTISQTAGSATVQLRSTAVHADRIDHVCGSIGLVRSTGGWLLDSFRLGACEPAAPRRTPRQARKRPAPPPHQSRPPGKAKKVNGHGKGHGGD
jgi:eukaryotic-like serine/threonine-protein kinase